MRCAGRIPITPAMRTRSSERVVTSGKTAITRVRWIGFTNGRRSPMWSEIQCERAW